MSSEVSSCQDTHGKQRSRLPCFETMKGICKLAGEDLQDIFFVSSSVLSSFLNAPALALLAVFCISVGSFVLADICFSDVFSFWP